MYKFALSVEISPSDSCVLVPSALSLRVRLHLCVHQCFVMGPAGDPDPWLVIKTLPDYP